MLQCTKSNTHPNQRRTTPKENITFSVHVHRTRISDAFTFYCDCNHDGAKSASSCKISALLYLARSTLHIHDSVRIFKTYEIVPPNVYRIFYQAHTKYTTFVCRTNIHSSQYTLKTNRDENAWLHTNRRMYTGAEGGYFLDNFIT